ncbi:MAG TPA: helix-turn-helix domain-containing protein [Candidatus Bathyarchaeia archaeon]|nr:helix-turn-helix domain-containing protein [Candidatus Bathyarchaeia archaeon]
METKARRRTSIDLPTISQTQQCDFEGYDAISLMTETAKLRKLITKRGTLEILIPLCCTTNPVRYLKFRQTLKGFSSKTLAIRLKELQKAGILERQAFNEIPPRVEYRLTDKGQELVESIIGLLHWMRKWSIKTHL